MLGDAEAKAEDLLALIEDLLEVARIEESAIDARSRADRAGRVAHRDRARVGRCASSRRARRSFVDVADDAPVFEADKALLKRVFANLIQNALTHSATRGRRSRSGARRDGDGGCCSPWPTTAPGIPPEYHEMIFRKFERVKTPHMPRVRSSGLGLAFCKLVVEAHGGRIWVQSSGGERAARSTSRSRCIRRRRRWRPRAVRS